MSAFVKKSGYALIALLVAAGIQPECGGESDTLVRAKLNVILADDLKTVVDELPDTSVADSTYYTIVLYREFEEGIYSCMAKVDFYIFKNVDIKMVRKYRYHRDLKKWERYYNVYSFIHEP